MYYGNTKHAQKEIFKKAQTNKRAGRYMLPSNTIRIAEAIQQTSVNLTVSDILQGYFKEFGSWLTDLHVEELGKTGIRKQDVYAVPVVKTR